MIQKDSKKFKKIQTRAFRLEGFLVLFFCPNVGDTCSRSYTDLMIYYIDAHQFSVIGLGPIIEEDIPYLAIQLTQEQEKHPILGKKRSAMGVFTALQQKMNPLKGVRK